MMIDAQEVITQLGVPLTGLSADSRRLSANEGFLAYPGAVSDGRCHIPAALQAGAAAVFWEADNFSWREEWQTPNRAVVGLRHNAGLMADVVYRRPSACLPVVAITGTNGKTTIAHYVAQLLEFAGLPTGIIGTLGVGRIGEMSASTNTTPEAAQLQGHLRSFVDDGLQAAAVEASSHGIEQGRLNGVRLAAAVFANAGRDHLDYHKSVEEYWACKAKLFDLPSVEMAILNGDDSYCLSLAKKLQLPTQTYGQKGTALRLLNAKPLAEGGFVLTVDGVLGRGEYRLQADGLHNVSNFLAAALAVHAVGIDSVQIAEYAPRLKLPQGRLQRVNDAPAVYVDYAHTPDAFAAVLSAMRPKVGRLLVVFGCGGGRDQGKRQLMGRLAADAAELVFITDDNPRDEDPAAIRTCIQSAAPQAFNIEGRQAAIAAALKEARAEDTVLVLGKGHEEGQEVGGVWLPFSDVKTIRHILGKEEA